MSSSLAPSYFFQVYTYLGISWLVSLYNLNAGVFSPGIMTS